LSSKVRDFQLAKWREEIDAIDRQIVELVGRRLTASAAAGFRKHQLGLSSRDRAREKELLERVDDGRVKKIYGRILDACRKHSEADLRGALDGGDPGAAT
jgi:chorismate mutase